MLKPRGVKSEQNEWGFVDFLYPESYVAYPCRADELIEYIKRHRFFKVDGLYVAKPEVVFYTRLVIGNWGVYLEKDIRDFRRGLLIEKDRIYAGVKAIADIFGTRHLVDERLIVLEEHVQSNFSKRT